ncbi:hypothetical protein HDU84_004679 [Entophlyctis sp. JEL0112]|nr:hypothetical protein HDU84_004679 [Entophlyctis sp. JEL0112]
MAATAAAWARPGRIRTTISSKVVVLRDKESGAIVMAGVPRRTVHVKCFFPARPASDLNPFCSFIESEVRNPLYESICSILALPDPAASEMALLGLMSTSKTTAGDEATKLMLLKALHLLYVRLGDDYAELKDECFSEILALKAARSWEMGQWNDAEPMYKCILDLKTRRRTNDVTAVVAAVNLAKIYERRISVDGDCNDSKYLHSFYILQSIERVALLFEEEGNFAAAKQKYLQLLDLQKKLLGGGHEAAARTESRIQQLSCDS